MYAKTAACPETSLGQEKGIITVISRIRRGEASRIPGGCVKEKREQRRTRTDLKGDIRA